MSFKKRVERNKAQIRTDLAAVTAKEARAAEQHERDVRASWRRCEPLLGELDEAIAAIRAAQRSRRLKGGQSFRLTLHYSLVVPLWQPARIECTKSQKRTKQAIKPFVRGRPFLVTSMLFENTHESYRTPMHSALTSAINQMADRLAKGG